MNKKIIIVVEDDSDMQTLLKTTLTESGFSVLVAKDGVEALSKIQSEKPDLVLLDILLPGMNGMSVLKEMREVGIATPVIILTNLSADEKIMQGILHDNPSYYLVKSDTPMDDIVTKIKGTLGAS